MSIRQGWVDWAVRVPGVPDKVYSQSNSGLGLVGHSIVGNRAAAEARFFSEDRDAQGRYTAYAAASVMFEQLKDGTLIQMYPVWSSTWTSGGREANTSLWAIELEGGPPGNVSEPMTDEQVNSLLHLAHEWEQFTGLKCVRGGPEQKFWEHGEVAAKYGYGATSCPSGRYARFYAALGGNDVTREEYENLVLAFASGSEEASLDRETRLTNAVYRINQIAQGERQSLLDLMRSVTAKT